MRQDQYERLQQLEEKLVETFLGEAEPAKWPGAGLEPATMDKDTRGDRYWCKKNAVATMSLIQRVGSLVGQVQARGAGTTPPAVPGAEDEEEATADADVDREIGKFEKEAERLIKGLQSSAKKASGKPNGSTPS